MSPSGKECTLTPHERQRQTRPGRPAAERFASGSRSRLPLLVVANVVLLVVLLAGVELGARVFFPRSLEAVFHDPEGSTRNRPFVVHDASRGFVLRAGFDGPECRVNAEGFRGPELPANWPARPLIVALGESTTFGWGVRDAETYPASLQERLMRRDPDTPWLVLNAGVPSYTSPQVLRYLDDILARREPKAVLVGVAWNDVLFSYVDNWMPDYLIHQQPARWRQILLRHSGLYRALALDDPKSKRPAGAENPAALEFYRRNLESIAARCARKGVPILFLQPTINERFLPETGLPMGRHMVPKASFLHRLQEYRDALETVARSRSIPIVQHRSSTTDGVPDEHFIDPVHLSRLGNALLAEEVESVLAASGILPHGGRDGVTPPP